MRRTKAFRLQLSLVPGEAMAAPRSLSRLSSHGSLRAGLGLGPRSAVRIQRISLSGLQHVRTVTTLNLYQCGFLSFNGPRDL